ncbi:MAG: AbrB/MazE/SpoVT family DNA-binding domain-containing protein [Candidatus Lokiarchaeota archaeon]|nr:AbrB/MazE/SpoVT family DNA-binding domain-containing protein [Candidatus Lokiarchaeota archaeon]
MSLTKESQIGKKHTIYLPKTIVDKARLEVGMKILITVEGNKIIIEPLPDPITLALHGKKFASMTLEEIEAISVEEQSRQTDDTS